MEAKGAMWKDRPRPLFERIAADAAERARAGSSGDQIARELGVSLATVYRALKHAEVQPANPRQLVKPYKTTPSITDEIIRLYKSGTAVEDIAAAASITVRTIYRVLDRHRIARRRKS